MKVVFIHIPKTAGSSVSDFLLNNSRGDWIQNGLLSNFTQNTVVDYEYLAGHFTFVEFLNFARRENIDIFPVQFLTCVRNPLDQLYSNLCYPFELQRRCDPMVDQDWFAEAVKTDVNNPRQVTELLMRYNWLLNMQSYYLFDQSTLDERLALFKTVSIFPDAFSLVKVAAELLDLPIPADRPHRNMQGNKIIPASVMADPYLREYIISSHARDYWLFRQIILKKANSEPGSERLEVGGWSPSDVPMQFSDFYDNWLAQWAH